MRFLFFSNWESILQSFDIRCTYDNLGNIQNLVKHELIYRLFVLYNEAFVITVMNVNDSFVKFTYLYMIVMK